MQKSLWNRAVRRDLRMSLGDGSFYSIMVGCGETYLAAFALALGMGAASAGLVTTLPMLGGALLQLAVPRISRRISPRRWVVGCVILQALCYLPLIAGALAGQIGRAALFGAMVAYWATGMAGGTVWNSWIDTLVPLKLRARFFAVRQWLVLLAVLAAVVGAGLWLDLGSGRDMELHSFAALFVLALLARLVSARFLSLKREAAAAAPTRSIPLREMLQRIAAGGHTRMFLLMAVMHFAVHVASPFFAPYMLKELHYSYGLFTLMICAPVVVRIAASSFYARFATRWGSGRLLWGGALGIVPLPILWLVSANPGYILGMMMLSGLVWGAYELAVQLAIFEDIPLEERTSFLSTYSLVQTGAMAAGSACGALLLTTIGTLPYFWVFGISTLLRALALLPLRNSIIAVRGQPLPIRIMAIRPMLGYLTRPVLTRRSESRVPAKTMDKRLADK